MAQIVRSSQFETRAKNKSDFVSPPLETDLIGRRRDNSWYPAVGVISANGNFHAGHIDLLSDHVGELLGTAAVFHHRNLQARNFQRRRGFNPLRQIARDSWRREGGQKKALTGGWFPVRAEDASDAMRPDGKWKWGARRHVKGRVSIET